MIAALLKDSAIYGSSDLLSKAFAFFAFPIIAAVLSPLAFGAMELIVTTTAILGLIMNCGLNNAVNRYYWDKDTPEQDRPAVVSSGLLVMVVFGLLVLFVGLLVVPILTTVVEDSGLPVTWIALVAALFLMVFSQWLQYMLDITRLHFKPTYFASLSLSSRVLGLALGIIAVVWFGWGVDGLLGVQALAAATVLPFGLWMIKKDLSFNVSMRWMKSLTHFGYPFIYTGIAYWIFGSMDRWMLAAMSSVEEVGVYSIAFRLASIVLLVSVAFGQAWSPYAMKVRMEKPEKYREIYAKVLLLLLVVMLTVGGGVALFSGELIGLIMPEEFSSGSVPLAILCFGIVMQSTQQVTAIGISLEKKTFIFARLVWITAFINFALNYLLIPVYGGQGAAWATTISYVVLTGSYLYYTQRLHPLPVQWRKLALILAIGCVVLVFSLVENTVVISWNLILLKMLFSVICLGIAWKMLRMPELFYGEVKKSEKSL